MLFLTASSTDLWSQAFWGNSFASIQFQDGRDIYLYPRTKAYNGGAMENRSQPVLHSPVLIHRFISYVSRLTRVYIQLCSWCVPIRAIPLVSRSGVSILLGHPLSGGAHFPLKSLSFALQACQASAGSFWKQLWFFQPILGKKRSLLTQFFQLLILKTWENSNKMAQLVALKLEREGWWGERESFRVKAWEKVLWNRRQGLEPASELADSIPANSNSPKPQRNHSEEFTRRELVPGSLKGKHTKLILEGRS